MAEFKRIDSGPKDLTDVKAPLVARSLWEYSLMFNLADGVLNELSAALSQRPVSILDMAGSTGSFARQLSRNFDRIAGKRGYAHSLELISADVAFKFEPKQLFEYAMSELHVRLPQEMRSRNTWEGEDWVSSNMPLPRDLYKLRSTTYEAWMKDIKEKPARYIPASFPNLVGLEGRQFDLILVGNCLFAYAGKFGPDGYDDFAFHRDSLFNMAGLLKPGGQIRVYPVSAWAQPSYPQIGALLTELNRAGFEASLQNVLEPPNDKRWDTLLLIRRAE